MYKKSTAEPQIKEEVDEALNAMAVRNASHYVEDYFPADFSEARLWLD